MEITGEAVVWVMSCWCVLLRHMQQVPAAFFLNWPADRRFERPSIKCHIACDDWYQPDKHDVGAYRINSAHVLFWAAGGASCCTAQAGGGGTGGIITATIACLCGLLY